MEVGVLGYFLTHLSWWYWLCQHWWMQWMLESQDSSAAKWEVGRASIAFDVRIAGWIVA